MWIFTAEAGFISVVQKAGESGLCLRARNAADLDAFRERYCPSLSPTAISAGGDYECRAWASHAAVAQALAKAALDVCYPNFKAEVAARQGKGRAAIYGRVWQVLLDLAREGRVEPVPATVRRAPATRRKRWSGGARGAGDGGDGR
jgi:hypothetical protein